jgi:hypothetical protein
MPYRRYRRRRRSRFPLSYIGLHRATTRHFTQRSHTGAVRQRTNLRGYTPGIAKFNYGPKQGNLRGSNTHMNWGLVSAFRTYEHSPYAMRNAIHRGAYHALSMKYRGSKYSSPRDEL